MSRNLGSCTSKIDESQSSKPFIEMVKGFFYRWLNKLM
jgi:hypothetical protein